MKTQVLRHEYQDTRHETQDTNLLSKSLVSKSRISKTPSLCNIPVTPNKKGDRCNSHHPNLLQYYPPKLQRTSDNAGEKILVIIILITKTLQMYVFF